MRNMTIATSVNNAYTCQHAAAHLRAAAEFLQRQLTVASELGKTKLLDIHVGLSLIKINRHRDQEQHDNELKKTIPLIQ